MSQGILEGKGSAILKLLAVGIGILVAGIAASGILFYAMMRHFHPPAPAAHYAEAGNALELQRQDLEYFELLIALDRAFSIEARLEATRRIEALKLQTSVLDGAHFRGALMEIDALADNGHSEVSNDHEGSPQELPIRVAEFPEGLFVMRATEPNADLLGGRVTAVDGQLIETVISRLALLRGGAPQWRKAYASQFVVVQDLLYGTDVARDAQKSTWTVVTRDGSTVSRSLSAYAPPASQPWVFVKRWMSSDPVIGFTADWRALEARAPAPVSLQDFDNAFRSFQIPGSCTWFVQLKSNSDVGTQRIKDFTSQTRARMRQSQPCNVILDLRFDDGGNYLNTYRFARELPGLIAPTGRIYVLTGPWTFSAGISTVAFVKNAAPNRVLILGEPVGDRAAFFSEGGRACLPHHPLCVSYETGKHDYQHSCKDWGTCYWLDFLLRSRVTSLDPDETIATRFEDWDAGIDPVLTRALHLSKGVSPSE